MVREPQQEQEHEEELQPTRCKCVCIAGGTQVYDFGFGIGYGFRFANGLKQCCFWFGEGRAGRTSGSGSAPGSPSASASGSASGSGSRAVFAKGLSVLFGRGGGSRYDFGFGWGSLCPKAQVPRVEILGLTWWNSSCFWSSRCFLLVKSWLAPCHSSASTSSIFPEIPLSLSHARSPNATSPSPLARRRASEG